MVKVWRQNLGNAVRAAARPGERAAVRPGERPARPAGAAWRHVLADAARLLADERGYIDPGTGSMLFTILISLVTAGVYALRNLAVKLRFMMTGGRQKAADDGVKDYVIFAESKRYWNVFEPICDEFERRGVALTYYTASPDDPALDKPYDHVTCEFIGEGNKAFARMNMLKAGVVVATTPGLDVYQWKRSRDVQRYVHVLHAASDVSMYRMFGIDYYDALLLSGDFQARQVRQLEELRGLPAKDLQVVGLTYFDAMARRLEEAGPAPEHERTVLLAPSWGKSAILSLYGGALIDALLDTGFHVIVRPHPQSFESEADLIERLMAEYPESERLEWNRDNDNFEVLRRSDVMISDFSGVIFDFALVFDKPVIYTEPAYDKDPYDACWLEDEPWTFGALPRMGRQLNADSMGRIGALVNEVMADPTLARAREEIRQECWRHRGEAAARIADYLIGAD